MQAQNWGGGIGARIAGAISGGIAKKRDNTSQQAQEQIAKHELAMKAMMSRLGKVRTEIKEVDAQLDKEVGKGKQEKPQIKGQAYADLGELKAAQEARRNRQMNEEEKR